MNRIFVLSLILLILTLCNTEYLPANRGNKLGSTQPAEQPETSEQPEPETDIISKGATVDPLNLIVIRKQFADTYKRYKTLIDEDGYIEVAVNDMNAMKALAEQAKEEGLDESVYASLVARLKQESNSLLEIVNNRCDTMKNSLDI